MNGVSHELEGRCSIKLSNLKLSGLDRCGAASVDPNFESGGRRLIEFRSVEHDHYELEDYLDVLEDITISFDEEDQNLNFAEGTDRYAISKRPAVLTNLCV